MTLEDIITRSEGYLELGMVSDAWDVLDDLPPSEKLREDVLNQRLDILIEAKKWSEAVTLGSSMCLRFPNTGKFFNLTAIAHYRLGDTQEAKNLMLSAPISHKSEANYFYNLACYDAQLGNIEEAKIGVQKAIQLDRKFQKLAIDDPDLAPLFPILKFH